MTINFESHPDNEGVIDRFTNMIYESEYFNEVAANYAFEVLHHYFGEFDLEWYHTWITTEDFRGGKYPDGMYYEGAKTEEAALDTRTMRRYEKMYDLYWDARSEWFNLMIANLNRKNLEEAARIQFQHTLSQTVSWEAYGEAVKAAPRVTHNMSEDGT